MVGGVSEASGEAATQISLGEALESRQQKASSAEGAKERRTPKRFGRSTMGTNAST
jgi:hypothetical protein